MGLSINDALFNLSYWKIAGLRPAIFSGTPGNFKAEYSGLCLSFQAIENPLLQNYAKFESFFWKIAGLRPAIFSGTPGNFDFIFLKGVTILDRLVEQTPIE